MSQMQMMDMNAGQDTTGNNQQAMDYMYMNMYNAMLQQNMTQNNTTGNNNLSTVNNMGQQQNQQ
jgi:hypothetical protein